MHSSQEAVTVKQFFALKAQIHMFHGDQIILVTAQTFQPMLGLLLQMALQIYLYRAYIQIT